MAEGIQMHISSLLMHDRPSSFCIVSDNALAVNTSEAMSTKRTPRRAKSASRHGVTTRVNRPFSRTRSAPNRLPKRRDRSSDTDNMPVISGSRWSSIPDNDHNKALQPPRRGLSDDSREQLHKLASSRRPQNKATSPPVKPMRKFLDDESSTCSSAASATSLPPYLGNDMSLAQCLVHTTQKKRTKGVRTIRRPAGGSDEKRQNIADILDAALGSLDLDVNCGATL